MPAVKLPTPHAGQAMVLRECGRFNALECGRRWGKTTFGLGLACEYAAQGRYVGWFVPTYKYFADAWDELRKLLHPLIATSNKTDGRIVLHTGGMIDVWSTHGNPGVGRGRKYHLVIVDEAALIDGLLDIWNNSIRPTLTDYKGEAWFLSTPAGHNDFHTLYERGQQGSRGWSSWRMGSVTNPYLDPDEIEAARLDMPDAAFKQEYLGIPAADAGNPFDIRKIEACTAPMSTKPAQVYGVDIALTVDYTVVVGLDDDGAVCHFDRYQGTDYEALTPRIAEAIRDRPALIDATGVGRPVLDALRTRHGCGLAEPFVFTTQSKQALIEELVYEIQGERLRFPPGDIERELRTFRYEYRPGGKVRYSAPSGLHDDCVCALALASRIRRSFVPLGIVWGNAGGNADTPRTRAQRLLDDPNWGFDDD